MLSTIRWFNLACPMLLHKLLFILIAEKLRISCRHDKDQPSNKEHLPEKCSLAHRQALQKLQNILQSDLIRLGFLCKMCPIKGNNLLKLSKISFQIDYLQEKRSQIVVDGIPWLIKADLNPGKQSCLWPRSTVGDSTSGL